MTKIKLVAVVKRLVERTDHKGTWGNFYTLIMESVTQECLSKTIELYTKKREFNWMYILPQWTSLEKNQSIKDEYDVICTSGFSRQLLVLAIWDHFNHRNCIKVTWSWCLCLHSLSISKSVLLLESSFKSPSANNLGLLTVGGPWTSIFVLLIYHYF